MYIEIKDLDFEYPQRRQRVLRNVSLSLEKGKKLCILGESGSGKSTVLRLIAGLEKPQKGSISIHGEILADERNFMPPEHRGIGMVFQDYALFPHMTVAQNIVFGLKKIKKSEKEQKLSEILSMIQMEAFKNRYPYELSGGQQQRVALGRALILKPRVILLDEPLSNLDTSLKIKIRSELKQMLDQAGITTILVTHDKEDCIAIADDVIILKDGEIIQAGSLQDVLEKPLNAYVALLL